eukprot:jgi/Botrbrau1/12380/Bobra.0084s0004.3
MMVFVNHCGSWPTWLPHSSWNGIHFADFVMPSFLFTVGISLTLSVLPRAILGSSSQVLHKVATRTGKLFLLGLFIQGGVATGLFPNYNLATLRIMGVLQRIAVTFMIAALLIIATSHASCAVQAVGLRRAAAHVLIQVSVVASIWFALYSASTLLVKVPSCPDTVPAIIPSCNVAAFVDFELLGPNHMYPFPTCRQADPPCPFFDPEGLYTTLGGAMLSTLLGVMAGCILHICSSHQARLLSWLVPSIVCCIAGLGLHLFCIVPLNKNLYSPSYVLLTGGTSGLLLCIAYYLHDYNESPLLKRLAAPCMWLGMNSIAVYAGDEIGEQMLGWVYYKDPSNNLKALLYAACQLLTGATNPASHLVLASLDVVFWVFVARHLYKQQIFMRI